MHVCRDPHKLCVKLRVFRQGLGYYRHRKSADRTEGHFYRNPVIHMMEDIRQSSTTGRTSADRKREESVKCTVRYRNPGQSSQDNQKPSVKAPLLAKRVQTEKN